MKSYLNAKLILFREILKSESTIISDQEIRIYSFLRKLLKEKSKTFEHKKKNLKELKIIIQISIVNLK